MLSSAVVLCLGADGTDGGLYLLCPPDLWPGQWPVVRCTASVCHTFPVSEICIIATFSACSCGMRIVTED